MGEERGDAVEGRLDGAGGGVEDGEDLAGGEEVVGGAAVEPWRSGREARDGGAKRPEEGRHGREEEGAWTAIVASQGIIVRCPPTVCENSVELTGDGSSSSGLRGIGGDGARLKTAEQFRADEITEEHRDL